jgi:aryl-alcohol dehydrogenase-like predicted oxidoreductase
MDLMADGVEAGKIRAVGVSNYNAEQMRAAHTHLRRLGLVLASNQVQYSLLRRNPETDGVLDACRELGVTLIAYMPLASGALTGKYSADMQPAGWRRRSSLFRNENLPGLIQLLGEIGDRHDRTPSQVALRWLIQQDGVLPIPGARNASQAAQNAGALTFTLEDAEVETLSRLGGGMHS